MMGKSDILSSSQIMRIEALRNAVAISPPQGMLGTSAEYVTETARTFESYIRNGAK